MLIPDNGTETVDIPLSVRRLSLGLRAQKLITPEEVRDPMLRKALQAHSLAIMRPTTPEENDEGRKRLSE